NMLEDRFMSDLVPPHGGTLAPLLVQDQRERMDCIERAKTLPKLRLSSKEVSDIIMLATGAFSPLKGFMCRSDYQTVVDGMRLSCGLLWPIPVTVAVSKEVADDIKLGRQVALVDGERDEIMAGMVVEDKFTYNKKAEALGVFGTEDHAHPAVKKIHDQGEVYLGGPLQAYSEGEYPQKYPEFARPAETRAIFKKKGWRTVAAFQTRNPIHRSHEYLTKVAMEMCDGLFIHPIVGKLKADDIPADIRMKCYKAVLDNYYPKERVVLKVYPMEMRYGGPKEAVLHAVIRQNFGCSHLIVGRDHAGVGNYYTPFEAQEIFEKLDPSDLHIKPIKLDWTFWCYKCGAIVSAKTCPHPDKDRLMISGTELRAMLAKGRRPPEEFGRPEVMDILIDYYAGNRQK
ncbi:MAG: sulfate adenylyltransferase, partial [Sedimentisphaerales bacterium]|nr:sulfate adenylyltransferase [Sedimentisphaerales bacterium]